MRKIVKDGVYLVRCYEGEFAVFYGQPSHLGDLDIPMVIDVYRGLYDERRPVDQVVNWERTPARNVAVRLPENKYRQTLNGIPLSLLSAALLHATPRQLMAAAR